MGYKVLLVLEDPTYDQFIARPVVQRLLADAGKPNAKVHHMTEPHLGGIEQVFDERRWDQILAKYRSWDLFVVVIDRDGDQHRQERAAKWAKKIKEKNGVCAWCLAIEELEVWAMAPFSNKLKTPWKEVRAARDPKERFFEPLVKQLGFVGPGAGRKAMMRRAMQHFASITGKCPEVERLGHELAAVVKD